AHRRRFPPPARNRWPCRRSCDGADSCSSARPPCTPSWRPSASSTPISSTPTAEALPAYGIPTAPHACASPRSGSLRATRDEAWREDDDDDRERATCQGGRSTWPGRCQLRSVVLADRHRRGG